MVPKTMAKHHRHYLPTNKSHHPNTRDSTAKVILISAHRLSQHISTVLSPLPMRIIPKADLCSNHLNQPGHSRAMETRQINKATNKVPRRNYHPSSNSHPLNKTMAAYPQNRATTNNTSSQFHPNRQLVPCRLVCPVGLPSSNHVRFQ